VNVHVGVGEHVAVFVADVALYHLSIFHRNVDKRQVVQVYKAGRTQQIIRCKSGLINARRSAYGNTLQDLKMASFGAFWDAGGGRCHCLQLPVYTTTLRNDLYKYSWS